MRLSLVGVGVLTISFGVLMSTSGSFLVVDRPVKADVIVVLAGETDQRPTRAIELLNQGYAPTVLLDVPGSSKVFGQDLLTLARAYLDAVPEKSHITICKVLGLSTHGEVADVRRCLRDISSGKRILLVTSDFHTKRALSIFEHGMPEYDVSVAAARDPSTFGNAWWTRRQWAKVNLDEWIRLAWWESVERWR